MKYSQDNNRDHQSADYKENNKRMMYSGHPDDDCPDDIGYMGMGAAGMHEMPYVMLAHAYVPWQYYHQAFSPCEALMKGTLFPELWGVYPIPE